MLVLDQEFDQIWKKISVIEDKSKLDTVNTVRFYLMELEQDVDCYVKDNSWE